MKILFLSHRIPYPPNKGDKLRAFHIIKHLAQKHQITLLSFLDNPHEAEHVRGLEEYCSSVSTLQRPPWRSRLQTISYLAKNLPLTLGYFYSPSFKQLVKEKLAQDKYDLIFVFSSAMAQYVADYQGCPKILDLVDADSEKWLQYARYAPWWKAVVYRLEGKRLRAYERKIAAHFEACTVVTAQEQRLLKDIIPPDKLRVVKNGAKLPPTQKLPGAKAHEPSLLFIGGMFYFAYIDGILHFCQKSLPLIKKHFYRLKFYIVGARPTAAIHRLVRDEQIEVTGHVPRVEPYLEKTWVYVVPLRMAPGIQNKILEAMAYELPVVATSAAVSGIEAEPGRDLLVADSPADFAAAVNKLLESKQLRRQIGSQARRFVEENHNWARNLQALDEIIQEISG